MSNNTKFISFKMLQTNLKTYYCMLSKSLCKKNMYSNYENKINFLKSISMKYTPFGVKSYTIVFPNIS